MSITIITGGPISSIGPIEGTETPTLGNMISQIADEIDDTTEEYALQIQSAIFTAIRYCEREPFYFNQTRDITFPTISGQQFYTATDNAQIPKVAGIQRIYSEDGQGQRSILRRMRPEEMELLADNSAARGEPYAWTYFDQKLRLYPIPGASVYTIRMQLGPYRLDPLESADDSNAWTIEAFDMIKARAKYVVYKDILKDAPLATEALSDFEDQRDALKRESSRRIGTGKIMATTF